MIMLLLALDTSNPSWPVLYTSSSTYCKAERTLALIYQTMFGNDQLSREGVLGLFLFCKETNPGGSVHSLDTDVHVIWHLLMPIPWRVCLAVWHCSLILPVGIQRFKHQVKDLSMDSEVWTRERRDVSGVSPPPMLCLSIMILCVPRCSMFTTEAHSPKCEVSHPEV